jgi:hypothetical protein
VGSPPSFASLKDKLYASPIKGEERHYTRKMGLNLIRMGAKQQEGKMVNGLMIDD